MPDPDDADHDLDPEQGTEDHHVPGDLLALYEVLEWQAALESTRGRPQAQATEAAPVPGTFVSRAGWGARPSRGVTRLDNPSGVTYHWEGPRMGVFPHSSCATKVRGIQAFHMDSRGWTDVAYNEIVCPHGVIYDCRGRDGRSAANGTNLGNSSSAAVCALVGQGDPQPRSLYVGMLAARQYLREGGTGSAIWSHGDWKATECPGVILREWVKAGCPDPTPPETPDKVRPMFDPPHILEPIVDAQPAPEGGVMLLARSGALYAYGGARAVLGANGQPWFAGHKAARLTYVGPADDSGRGRWQVTTATDEKFRLPLA